MAGEALRERPEEVIPKAPAPRLGVTPVRRVGEEVKRKVPQEQRMAQEVMLSAYKGFDEQIAKSGNPELKRAWNASSLKTLLG